MAATNKIKITDENVQKNLALCVGKYIEVKGILSGGDPINKLEGAALQKNIEFQKNTQHRKYIQKDPYTSFRISNPAFELKDKDAFERLVLQKVYKGTEGDTKYMTVETKNRFSIGYRKGDVIVPIKKSSIEGKHVSYEQGLTVTFEVYQVKDTGVCGIGLANIIFDEKPKFYQKDENGDKIGAIKAQNWSDDVEDFGDEAETTNKVEEKAEKTDEFDWSDNTATETLLADSDSANEWDDVWG